LYARPSSADQKSDLDAQIGRPTAYAVANNWTIIRSVAKVGAGLNGDRRKLMKLLADPEVAAIVVEHRDRLMRFGAECVESALTAQGRKLVVIDLAEVKDDLSQEMMDGSAQGFVTAGRPGTRQRRRWSDS
jgi:predicted site-specific integrase-resolvase